MSTNKNDKYLYKYDVNENMGIYVVMCEKYKFCYIGISDNLKRRFSEHKNQIMNAKHKTRRFNELILKHKLYGEKSEEYFQYKVLANISQYAPKNMEKTYIEAFKELHYTVCGDNSRDSCTGANTVKLQDLQPKYRILYTAYIDTMVKHGKIKNDRFKDSYYSFLDKIHMEGIDMYRSLNIRGEKHIDVCKEIIERDNEESLISRFLNYIALYIIDDNEKGYSRGCWEFDYIDKFNKLYYNGYRFQKEGTKILCFKNGYFNEVILEIKKNEELNSELIRYVARFFRNINNLYDMDDVYDIVKYMCKHTFKINNCSDLLYYYAITLYCIQLEKEVI